MLQDLVLAIRMSVSRPGYALAVVVTLALGIGASTMMFSLVDAALLRPLPFDRPQDLVILTGVFGPDRSPRGSSFPETADWRSMNTTLEELAIYDEMSLNLRAGETVVRVDAELVGWSYFQLLGVRAARGRTFLPEEDTVPDKHAVVVISDRFWRDRLGSDPNVLERTLLLNDRPMQVVGVMPGRFAGISFDTDVWIPSMMVTLSNAPAIVKDRTSRQSVALGRLKQGVTLERARTDLTRVAALLEASYPDTNRQRGVDVDVLQTNLLGSVASQVRALFGAVLLFLAIACANAAGLQIVRASSRRRELAIRLALGATRWHVLRQLLVESSLLSIAAGMLGVLCAAWAVTLAIALTPEGALPRFIVPSVDPRTLAFTFGISVVVGLAVATLTAGVVSRANVSDALKHGGRTLDSSLGAIRRPSIQQLLVAGEIAAAMILLALAGLVVRSLDRQMKVELGFDPAGITVARVTLPAARYAPDARAVFVERLDASLRGIPGLESLALASNLPLTGLTSAGSMLPDTATTPEGALRYFRHAVTPDFFTTFGIPIVAGRSFTAQDRRGAPRVAIVNDSAASRIWGTTNAVGRRFRLGTGATEQTIEIVGIAATTRYRDLTTDLTARGMEPDVYFPLGQLTSTDLAVAIKTKDGLPVSIGALQQAVSQIDGNLPVYSVFQLDDVVRQQTSTPRFVSTLLSVFSAGALLLAAVGLYSLIAYVVSLSRTEIAIRLALGADGMRIIALIVRNGMAIVLAGIAAGVAGALAAGRAISTQLFQTSAADPLTLVVVATVLIIVTLFASAVPTRMALRVDPQRVLRGE
jgi:putative ABC transport system permease protein